MTFIGAGIGDTCIFPAERDVYKRQYIGCRLYQVV